jgi:hypothetical protein
MCPAHRPSHFKPENFWEWVLLHVREQLSRLEQPDIDRGGAAASRVSQIAVYIAILRVHRELRLKNSLAKAGE